MKKPITKLPILLRKSEKGPLTKITGANVARHGNHIIIWLNSNGKRAVEFRADVQILTRLLSEFMVSSLTDPDHSPRLNSQVNNWNWLMPETVIEYFRKSIILRPMLNDVIKAIGHLQNTETEAPALTLTPLSEDLQKVKKKYTPSQLIIDGRPKHGAQTRVAKMLDIPNAGQSNRRRILNVLKEMAA